MDYLQIAQSYIADNYPVIAYAQPKLMDLPPGTIVGTWAYSIRNKIRFILDKSLEVGPGVLPGDLARAWIRDQYKLPIKRRPDQLLHNLPAPIHAVRGDHGDCAYVDINKAYANILRLGYDLEYKPGKYIGAEPRPVPPEIRSNKLSYAMAVTMSGNTHSKLEIMGKKGLFEHKPLNIYSNPCLYALAQDTLNGIASEVLSVLGDKVVYANTDGFIVKEGFQQYAIDIIRSWGFEATIRIKDGIVLRGPCSVGGVSTYRINGYKTRRQDQHGEDFTGPLMAKDDRRWLKTRWALWTPRLPANETTQEAKIP